jgi:selenocysteine-specific elongation factor
MQVIATAGHVDHGKSTLLRALTGMEPDRWAEEKRRGLTIDLGFAWLTLPSGEQLAFVDVPGHERFVPNMLAGVGPVPAVLFIVAADEGWMPQSAEHLAVVDALGIRRGVLVITRADLADPGPALAQARAELSRSSLGALPAVAVSAVSGAGLPDLVSALEELTSGLPVPDPGAPVRLWVDRSFSMTGSGTVVTGTLPAGTVHRGDELVVTPSMRPVRVRDIQTLGESAPEATGVARVALNLRGVTKDSLARGMAVVQAGRWTTTDVIDVRICGAAPPAEPGLPDAAGPAGAGGADGAGVSELAVRLPRNLTLHIGSAKTLVRVRPLAGDIARLTLRDPLPMHVGDRVLLRDPGAARVPRRGGHGLGAEPAPLMPPQGAVPALASVSAAVPASASAPVDVPARAPERNGVPPVNGVPVNGAPALADDSALADGAGLAAAPRPLALKPVAGPGSLATPVVASPAVLARAPRRIAATANGLAERPAPAPDAADALMSAGYRGAAGLDGWTGIVGATVLDVTPPALTRRGAAAAAARELASWPDQPGAAELLRRHGLLRASSLLAMGVRDHPEPVTGEWLVDPDRWSALAAELGEVLAAHTAREPLAPGLPLEAARAALGLPDRRLVTALARPPFRISAGLVQLAPSGEGSASSGLPESVQAAVRILRADLATAPFAAPDAERLRKLGLDVRAVAAAARAGLLLRISDQIVLAPGADEAAARVLADLPQPFTAAQARQALGTTRRTAIPLLEYLDRAGVTERLPDDRRQCRPDG